MLDKQKLQSLLDYVKAKKAELLRDTEDITFRTTVLEESIISLITCVQKVLDEAENIPDVQPSRCLTDNITEPDTEPGGSDRHSPSSVPWCSCGAAWQPLTGDVGADKSDVLPTERQASSGEDETF